MIAQQLKKKLYKKRMLTENKIRQLDQEGKAGIRYSATISDLRFLFFDLLCDIGWIMHIVFEIQYLLEYGFHADRMIIMVLDILSFIAMLIVVFGVIVTIYLNMIHEKEIATRWQKNLSFGATIYGGLLVGIVGILLLMIGERSYCLVGMAIGGFSTFFRVYLFSCLFKKESYTPMIRTSILFV